MAFFSALELILFVFMLGLVLAISVPLSGALVRFRASYNPRGLALDAEGGATPYTGPVVNSYFGMIKRVYAIEGVSGLYKGIMPTLISAVVVSMFAIVFLDTSSAPVGHPHGYGAPDAGIIGTFFYSLFYTLISLPAIVITYRSIITPYRLPTFNPLVALRVLLTPAERARPWILYFTPGLLASQLLHISYVIFVLNVAGRKLLTFNDLNNLDWWRAVVYFLLTVGSTVFLTPLEVISTRLAIQRNHGAKDLNSIGQEAEGQEEYAEFYGDSEDVIGLRSERDPYLGMVDCARRIKEEEGLRALFRGWWVTAFGGLMKA